MKKAIVLFFAVLFSGCTVERTYKDVKPTCEYGRPHIIENFPHDAKMGINILGSADVKFYNATTDYIKEVSIQLNTTYLDDGSRKTFKRIFREEIFPIGKPKTAFSFNVDLGPAGSELKNGWDFQIVGARGLTEDEYLADDKCRQEWSDYRMKIRSGISKPVSD